MSAAVDRSAQGRRPCPRAGVRAPVRRRRVGSVVLLRSSLIWREIASPSPVPSPTCFVVKNGSKIFGSTSAQMPRPVSLIETTT